MIALYGSLFTIGLFFILLALLAYFREFKLSSKLLSAGLTHATISVLLLPPKLSCKILVNLESRYGICFLAAPFLPGSVSAEITFPNESKPILMFIPSFIVLPTAPVFFKRSLPAKSTKCNLLVLNPSSKECSMSTSYLFSLPSTAPLLPYKSSKPCYSKKIVKTACDLELV